MVDIEYLICLIVSLRRRVFIHTMDGSGQTSGSEADKFHAEC